MEFTGKFTVKQVRGLAGLTQNQMADELGIHRSTYIKLERNPGLFTMQQAEEICRITKYPMDLISFKK